MAHKRQIVAIHGGGEFAGLSRNEFLRELATREVSLERLRQKPSWKSNLESDLGEGYDVLSPRMPNSDAPRYEEWKLWLEKIIPPLDEEVILVGHSLGGLFLVKYLSENAFPREIRGLFCVAAPYVDEESASGLTQSGFTLTPPLRRAGEQSSKLFLYHSKDDPVVPFSDLARFQKELTKARTNVFSDRKHFNGEHFPELVRDIRHV